MKDGLLVQIGKQVKDEITRLEKQQRAAAPEFKYGDCSACHDGDVLLCRSEQEDEPLHYVCKECFLRGY